MEATLTRIKPVAIAIVKAIAIAATFALLYFIMCTMMPTISTSWFSGFVGTMAFRPANILRTFALWNPYSAIGTAIGAWLFNVSIGKGVAGIFPLSALLVALAGATTYRVSQWWGRSVIKDLVLTAGYGLVSGVLVATQLTTLSILLQNQFWGKLLLTAALFKIISTVVVMLLGYPLVRAFEKVVRDARRPTE